jgi:hypothetical protein
MEGKRFFATAYDFKCTLTTRLLGILRQDGMGHGK